MLKKKPRLPNSSIEGVETHNQNSTIDSPGGLNNANIYTEKISQPDMAEISDTAIGATVDSPQDSTLDYGHDQGSSLGNFLRRPVRIHDYSWAVNAIDPRFRLDPWQLLSSNKRVVNRLNNYRSMKADLHLRFVVNGNPFYYGRLMVSWIPLDLLVSDSAGLGVQIPLMGASQRLHTVIDPNLNEPVEMTIPFFFPRTHLNLTNGDQFRMGELQFLQLNPLQHSNGSIDPIRLTVFAWFDNETLCCPTNRNAAGLSPQTVEEKPGRIEKIATKVAATSGMFKDAPYIGKYAQATSHLSMGAAKIAALFGWSKPAQDVKQPMIPRVTDQLSTYDGQDDVNKLVLDSKQTLSIDPALTGLPRIDELAVSEISQRESYLTTFLWDQDKTEGHQLFSLIVDPGVFSFSGATAPRAFGILPCGLLAQTHKYWTGTMKYRFEVVCSSFHKGRIRIVYDPHSDPADEFNTNYSTVVDIGSNLCTTVHVGWAQPSAFRESQPIDYTAPSYIYGKNSVYSSDTRPYGNGTLSVFVVNDLTSPLSLSEISINVYVSCSDDVKFCAPYGDRIKQMTYVAPPASMAPQVGAEHAEVHFSKCEQPSSLLEGYFGESTISVRQLLKRYTYYTGGYTAGTGTQGFKALLSKYAMYPAPRQTYAAGSKNTPMDRSVVSLPGYYSSPYATSYFQIFAPCYAGVKGGMRWMVEDISSELYTEGAALTANTFQRIYLSRSSDPTPFFRLESLVGPFNRIWDIFVGSSDLDYMGATTRGFSVLDPHVNPVTKIEIPFYSNQKFSTSGVKQNREFGFATSLTDGLDSVAVTLFTRDAGSADSMAFTLYHSIGEDFSLLWFQQVPVLYFSNYEELGS